MGGESPQSPAALLPPPAMAGPPSSASGVLTGRRRRSRDAVARSGCTCACVAVLVLIALAAASTVAVGLFQLRHPDRAEDDMLPPQVTSRFARSRGPFAWKEGNGTLAQRKANASRPPYMRPPAPPMAEAQAASAVDVDESLGLQIDTRVEDGADAPTPTPTNAAAHTAPVPATAAPPSAIATSRPTPTATSISAKTALAVTAPRYGATVRLAEGQPPIMLVEANARSWALTALPLHKRFLLGPHPIRPTPKATFAPTSEWMRYYRAAPTSYDDLTVAAVPLSEAERARWPYNTAWSVGAGLIAEESGVRAVNTPITLRGTVVRRTNATDLAELSAKYCNHQRRYVAGIPNKGARLGNYFHNWFSMAAGSRLSIFSLARDVQATLLYHPILPNQRERQLFDRYFGFGYSEEAMLYEACVDGVVGEACNAYLPCLQVVRPASGTAASDIRRDTDARPGGDVVYELPSERLPSGDRTDPLLLQELRARFHRARSLDPLPLHYSEEDINIAIHARRGDVVDAARHQRRLTDDTAYGNLTATLLHHLRKYNLFGSALQNGRIKIHLFSQGSKEDFPLLLPLAAEGLLYFHLDEPLLQTLYHMTMADILICAKSGFSVLTALLREPWQPTLYPSDTFGDVLPSWVEFDGVTGNVADDEAAAMVNVLFGSLHRRHQLLNLPSRRPPTSTDIH